MTRGGRQFVDLASLDVLLPVEKEDPAAGAQRAKQPGGGAGSSRSSSDAQQGQHQQQQKKQQHVPPEASGASVSVARALLPTWLLHWLQFAAGCVRHNAPTCCLTSAGPHSQVCEGVTVCTEK